MSMKDQRAGRRAVDQWNLILGGKEEKRDQWGSERELGNGRYSGEKQM